MRISRYKFKMSAVCILPSVCISPLVCSYAICILHWLVLHASCRMRCKCMAGFPSRNWDLTDPQLKDKSQERLIEHLGDMEGICPWTILVDIQHCWRRAQSSHCGLACSHALVLQIGLIWLIMCPGYDSQTRRHMRTEFVGSLLCSKRFFSGNSGFPLSSKTNV